MRNYFIYNIVHPSKHKLCFILIVLFTITFLENVCCLVCLKCLWDTFKNTKCSCYTAITKLFEIKFGLIYVNVLVKKQTNGGRNLRRKAVRCNFSGNFVHFYHSIAFKYAFLHILYLF